MLGLGHSVMAGLGPMPLLGLHGTDLDAWRILLAQPGLWRAATLSLWTGMPATGISLMLAVGAVAALLGWPYRMRGWPSGWPSCSRHRGGSRAGWRPGWNGP